MSGGSLRLRLFAAGAGSILVALAIAGFGLLLLFERHVERRITAELEAHLRQLAGGLERAADGSLHLAREPAEPRFEQPLSGLYWQIAPAAGAPLLRSRSLWDDRLDLPPDDLDAGDIHRHTVPGPGGAALAVIERMLTLPASLGGARLRVAVAIDRAEIHAAGLAFAADLAPSLALLAAVLAAAAWVQVGVGLRPLVAIRQRLQDVRAGRIARLGMAFPEEVRPLAQEVDHLLDAQEAAITRARARAADLAHGLKTPLTVLASDAQDLRARGETQLADEIAAVTEGMRRHVEHELARARAAVRRRAPPQPLRPVVERVTAVLRRTLRGHDLDWVIDVPADLAAPVDEEDLAEMIGNLAENATKWAASRVCMHGSPDRDGIRLVIEDDGPGVPQDRIATVMARGGRLDEGQPGSGLGLAIVRDLAEAHGGSLRLSPSRLGGLAAELNLPLASHGPPVRPASCR